MTDSADSLIQTITIIIITDININEKASALAETNQSKRYINRIQ